MSDNGKIMSYSQYQSDIITYLNSKNVTNDLKPNTAAKVDFFCAFVHPPDATLPKEIVYMK